jgi:hypothetical protein
MAAAAGPATIWLVDVDEVADELYGLPPDQFTEARNGRVKELRASGDRRSVEAIRRLAKPSVAAWMANLLVRTRQRSIEELLDLGRGLREAQRSGKGDDIRRLSARRQELVRQLTGAAAEEASATGHAFGAQHQRQLEETLEAAVADESAASALRAGRLTDAMAHVGFGEVAALERTGRPSGRARPQPESKPPSHPSSNDERRSEASRRALARADDMLVRARATLERSDSVLDEARERHQAASAARREAAKALQDAEREVKAASAELARSQQRRQRADEAVKKAERERRRRM